MFGMGCIETMNDTRVLIDSRMISIQCRHKLNYNNYSKAVVLQIQLCTDL